MQLTNQELHGEVIKKMVAGGMDRQDAEQLLNRYKTRLLERNTRIVKTRLRVAFSEFFDKAME